MALATALLILLVAAPAAYGAQYTVGGTSGWSSGVDYTTWASDKTFNVGDTLLFNYDGSHKVDVVTQAAYTACSTSNPLSSFSDGATTISLDAAGPAYFICPTSGHCANGMKLTVNVVASGTPATPSPPPTGTPTTPSPPATDTPTTPSPPATTTPAGNASPPPPPPPAGSGASTFNINMVGVPVVLATLIAFMV